MKIQINKETISKIDPSILHLLRVDPPLEVALGELLPELQDVLLEALVALQFPGLEVAIDVLFVDLVDGKLAEEGLGLVKGFNSVGLMDLPQPVGL